MEPITEQYWANLGFDGNFSHLSISLTRNKSNPVENHQKNIENTIGTRISTTSLS
tara:strand:+ start:800 stop:964 length:165 start_codon:yes stop_codon:yes gene_type:complete